MAIKIEDVVNILRHAPKRGLSATQIGNRLNLKSTDLDALEAELAIAMRNGTVCFDGKHYTLPPERVTATKSGAETTASPEPIRRAVPCITVCQIQRWQFRYYVRRQHNQPYPRRNPQTSAFFTELDNGQKRD